MAVSLSAFKKLKNKLSHLFTLKSSYSIKTQTKSCAKYHQRKHHNINWSLEFNQRIFYVIFTDTEHFFSKFLKKGFSHCYAIERLEHVYILYDPTRSGLNVYMPPCSAEHPLVDRMISLNPELKVLEVRVKQNNLISVMGLKPLNCVSTLEYILGLKFGVFGSLTPYRLYKSLLEANHQNVIGTKEYGRSKQSSKRSATCSARNIKFR